MISYGPARMPGLFCLHFLGRIPDLSLKIPVSILDRKPQIVYPLSPEITIWV